MSTETTNGTPLRDLTSAERKAVDLRARGALDAAIRIETGLSPEQVDVAVQRHTAWQKLRGKTQASAALMTPDIRRTVSALLTWAEGSGITRATTLAARVREQLAELRSLQEQDEERTQAQADIDRLTAELAAAKARLRGASGKTQTAPVIRGPGAVPGPERKAYLDAIRVWAAGQGTPVNSLGRIPRHIQDAYDAAHGGTA